MDADHMSGAKTLIIACGALAREITWLITANHWDHLQLTCLPAELHNRPGKIPAAMREKIMEAKQSGLFRDIVVLYGDCGTGGALDKVLAEEGVERIGGAHCYQFFSGDRLFAELCEEEIGSFFLTDYLVRFFDRLIIKGLGLDRFPDLRDQYFAHYKRVVHLSQSDDPALLEKGRQAAHQLKLDYVHRHTGLGAIDAFLENAAPTQPQGTIAAVRPPSGTARRKNENNISAELDGIRP